MTCRCPALAIRVCLVWLVFMKLVTQADALFGLGNKKKKQREAEEASLKEAALQKAEEALQRAKYFSISGHDIPKTALYYAATALLGVLIAAFFLTRRGKKLGNRPKQTEDTIDVVVVGCGLPKKGMGCYHLTQLLEMTNVNVRAVVEPFYLDSSLCKETPESFSPFVSSLEEKGILVTSGVESIPQFTKLTMCLIAGLTTDNPRLFEQCIEKGAKVIYLEKPGASTVQELEHMRDLADEKRVKVYMGYNKNVSPFVQKAVSLARTIPDSHVFFCHNNSYTPTDLPEVFVRNPEGMLKNMAVHELALLVTFFGVTVDTIENFRVNTSKLFSEKLTVWVPGTSLPNPAYITDFSRIAFKITTKNGQNVSVMADRTGGNVSFAVVKDGDGHEVQKFESSDEETLKKVEEQCRADPEIMPYFLVQSDDYLELKTRIVDTALKKKGNDDEYAEGVATIQIGIEALKLAEYGTTQLNNALKAE